MGTIENFPHFNPVDAEGEPTPTIIVSKVNAYDSRGMLKEVIPVHEVMPPKEKLKSLVPVVITPGFTEGIKTLEGNLMQLAAYGRRSFTYDAPTGIRDSRVKLEKIQEREFHEYELGKAAALLEVIDGKKFEQVDAVGHSEGCIYLVMAALENPEKFRNLVLVNPGGMVGQDNFYALIRRAYRHLQQEKKSAVDPEVRASIQKARSERVSNLIQNAKRFLPGPRAVACTQIEALLEELHNQGIHIVIIHSVDDLVFPMDRVQQMTKGSYIDGFYSVKGGHNGYILEPDTYAYLTDQVLTALEAKAAKAIISDLPEDKRLAA